MRRYFLISGLILSVLLLTTGCNLFSSLSGGDDGPHYHHFYGMVEANDTLYISAFEADKVTTVAMGEDINPEDFHAFEYPHGLAYGGGSSPDTNIWVCDLNDQSIKSYTGGSLDSTTMIGTEPVNMIFLPAQDNRRSAGLPRRILVADRMENCLHILSFNNDGTTLSQNEIATKIDLSSYMEESAVAYIDMYLEGDLVYIVSNEFFGFLTIDIYDSDPVLTHHPFTGTQSITEIGTDMGGMGIAVHDSLVYVNTGGRIIRSSPTGTDAEVLCSLSDLYPDNTGYYIDMVISDSVRNEGYTPRFISPPTYIYVASGLFWDSPEVATHLVRCGLDGSNPMTLELDNL